MAIINLDLVGSLAATQGYPWRVMIMYPGNVLGGGVRSAIKAAYDGQTLTAFRPEAMTYDAAIGHTRIPITLNRTQTRQLPATENGFLLYEVEFTPPGRDRLALLAGKFQIKFTLL